MGGCGGKVQGARMRVESALGGYEGRGNDILILEIIVMFLT